MHRPFAAFWTWLQDKPMNYRKCLHTHILVDLHHTFADVSDIPVSSLQAQDPTSTRPWMSLSAPRCADCGIRFSLRELKGRIRQGGDLYDVWFHWSR